MEITQQDKFVVTYEYNPGRLSYLRPDGILYYSGPEKAAVFSSIDAAVEAITNHVFQCRDRSKGWSIKKRVEKTTYEDVEL